VPECVCRCEWEYSIVVKLVVKLVVKINVCLQYVPECACR
jgi:hypothetical protein